MNKLNYFYRVDNQGNPVPGTLQRFLKKPNNGQWKQFDYNNVCCIPSPLNPIDIDVFLVGGQSNAKGRATDVVGGGPAIGSRSIFQVNSSIITKANDPVGSGNNQAVIGSAWPQFGITYQQLTNKKVCFALSAVSGASQLAAADRGLGNWSTTGTCYGLSLGILNNTLSTLINAGYNPIFKGILWCQGEYDADAINSALVTQAQYMTEFQTMLGNFRALYGDTMPLYFFRIGTRVGFPDAGYEEIRQAQQILSDTVPYVDVVYYNAVDFPARGLMNDPYHYKQAGYNEMGDFGAKAVVNIQNN